MVKKIHIVRKSRRRSRRRSPRKSKKNKKSNRRSRRKSNTKKLKGGTDPSQAAPNVRINKHGSISINQGPQFQPPAPLVSVVNPSPASMNELLVPGSGIDAPAQVNVEEWILKEYLIPHVGGKPKVLHQKSFTLTTKIQAKILKKFTSNRE
jgi:hypothetical protein